MNQTKILYHWTQTLATVFCAWSKPQVFMLAAFSYGVMLARCCTLARVAEALGWLAKPDSVERRLQRFLANGKIDWQVGCQCLARWVLSRLVFSNGLLVLLVDETALGEHFKVMAVSLAYRGRAIPLAWWCYPQDQYPMKQLALIDTLLGWVAPAIPPGCRVLVECDRGLSNSPALLRRITKRGWSYLVRVQKALHLVRAKDGREVRFSQLIQRPGQHWSGPVQAFKSAGWMTCWAIAYWGKGHQEPWLLLTNYQPAQAHWYGWRMWEELAFRDFKSYGWQWQKSRVWNPAKANRLWLVMAVAYTWTLSLGTQATVQELSPEVMRGKTRRHSLMRLGLRLLSRAQELFQKLVKAFDLVLITLIPSDAKTVV